MIVISFILYCCRSLARHPIVGSVLLFLYTIFATILVCSVTVYYEINLVSNSASSSVNSRLREVNKKHSV